MMHFRGSLGGFKGKSQNKRTQCHKPTGFGGCQSNESGFTGFSKHHRHESRVRQTGCAPSRFSDVCLL